MNVFPPVKCDWNPLYAEFDTLANAQLVYRYTRFLRHKDHRVTMYVPHTHFAQFEHLGHIAHKYCLPPNIHKTRIKFGNQDLYLQVKPPGSHVWQVVNVPDLPPLTLQQQPPPALSLSPNLAPGRPRRNGGPQRPASISPKIRQSKAARSSSPAEYLEPSEDAGDEEISGNIVHPAVDSGSAESSNQHPQHFL